MLVITPISKMISQHPRIGPYWRLVRMDKPVGSLLILWPTLTSLWIAAKGDPSLGLIVIFTLGTLLMRAAGCAINDYADRHLDGAVARTANRPLATGELAPKNALWCFATLCLIAFGLVLLTNTLTIGLSFVGALLAGIYPFLKRITHLPQVWLGLAMNWGIMMAYTAQAGHLTAGIWIFFAATLCWTIAYDTFYAMVDRDEDIQAGIKSIAILFGKHDRLITGVFQFTTLLGLMMTGVFFGLGLPFLLLSIVGSGSLFGYQQFLIRHRNPEDCFRAFMNNRWVALLIFAGVALDFLISSQL